MDYKVALLVCVVLVAHSCNVLGEWTFDFTVKDYSKMKVNQIVYSDWFEVNSTISNFDLRLRAKNFLKQEFLVTWVEARPRVPDHLNFTMYGWVTLKSTTDKKDKSVHFGK